MRVYMTMQAIGCEPRHCKHGGTFTRGERMNATDSGWFCDDCAEQEDDEPDPAYPFSWNSYETEIRP